MPETLGTAFIKVELVGWEEAMDKLQLMRDSLAEIEEAFPQRAVTGLEAHVEYDDKGFAFFKFDDPKPVPKPLRPQEF
ncbi:hypothetical protein SEA_SHAYRA_44 [Gordonia phage ShayRa]|nr:hypothetical protein SEA_SHAYRA_44 [Gordonia phage ShayRa]